MDEIRKFYEEFWELKEMNRSQKDRIKVLEETLRQWRAVARHSPVLSSRLIINTVDEVLKDKQ